MRPEYGITDLLAPIYFDSNGRMSHDRPTVLTSTREYLDPGEGLVVGWQGPNLLPRAFVVYSEKQVTAALELLRQSDWERKPKLICGRDAYYLKQLDKPMVEIKGLLARQVWNYAPRYTEEHGSTNIVRFHPPPPKNTVFVMVMDDRRTPGLFGYYPEDKGTAAVFLFRSKSAATELISRVPDLPTEVYKTMRRRVLDCPLPQRSRHATVELRDPWLCGWLTTLYFATKAAKPAT